MAYFKGKSRTLPQTVGKSLFQWVKIPAQIATLVAKPVAAGFTTRCRDTAGRRRIRVELTAAGRKRLERSPDILQDRLRRSFGSLREHEQALIVAALERVSAMLDAGDIDASPVLDVGDIDR